MKYIPNKMTYKEYEESYTVRHIADTVGFMFIFMLAVQIVWEFASLKLLMLVGVSFTKIQEYTKDPAVLLAINVLVTAVMFTVPFIALCSRERQRPTTLIHYGAPKKRTFLPLVALGSALCMVSNAASSIISQILEQFGITGHNNLENLPQGPLGLVLTIITMSLAPAFLEEFAFRGIVFGITRRLGEGFAIFASAICFSIMHMNMSQIPFAFLAGLIIGFVYVKSESIWTAVTVHAINNLLSIILNALSRGLNTKLDQLLTLAVIAASAVITLGSFLAYTKNGGDFSLCASDMELSNKKKAGQFLKSPTVIISIIATVLMMVAIGNLL